MHKNEILSMMKKGLFIKCKKCGGHFTDLQNKHLRCSKCGSVNQGEYDVLEKYIGVSGMTKIYYGIHTYGRSLFRVVKTLGRDFFYTYNHRKRIMAGRKSNSMPVGLWSAIKNKSPIVYEDLGHIYPLIDSHKLKKNE